MALNLVVRRSPFLKSQNALLISCASVSTENLRSIEKPTLESAKRGTGYRSSYAGKVCTVFGASGFYGGHVVNRLGKHGIQIIVPHRCSWYDILHLRTSADLGQMQFCDFCFEDEDSIRNAVKYSDTVINLIGRDWDTRNYKLERVHIDGARKIARICREMGVKKLIHTSSINVSPNPPELMLKGGSRFLKSKYWGEQAVREEFPDAIIVRPSETYGHYDRYFNYYGSNSRLIFTCLHLYEEGRNTIKQPVYVGDCAAGYAELVKRPLKDVAGKIYQFVGPRRYVLRDLCYYIFDHMAKDEEFFDFAIKDARFSTAFYVRWQFFHYCHINKPRDGICWERFERENLTDHFDPSLPNLRDLDVPLSIIDNYVWGLTRPHIAFKDYKLEESEYQQPPSPPIIQEI